MKKQIHVAIGAFLRKHREDRGLSQTEVASNLGVKPQFISNWERGMSSPPLRLMKQVRVLYAIPEQQLLDHMLTVNRAYLEKSLGVKRSKQMPKLI